MAGMVADSAPLWLRPIHRWFFWWEFVVPSIYRVLAVGVAAVLTAAGLMLVGLPLLIGAPIALATWIGLAVIQEHDERVVLPVDAEFLRALRDRVEPLLARHGFEFHGATGPCRARADRAETFLFERPHEIHGCADLWLVRDRSLGEMRLLFEGRELSRMLIEAGEVELARRVSTVVGADDDAEAILAGLMAVPERFWSSES